MEKTNVKLRHYIITPMIALIFTLFLIKTSFCADFSEKIRNEARIMANTLLNNDYETLTVYTFPLIVEKMGGKDKMIQVLQQGNIEMRSGGVNYDSVEIGWPDAVEEVNGKLYTLVPETIKMKVPQGILIQESNLIAISLDQGNKWYFIDTAGLDDQKLAMVLPELVGRIKIPPRPPPTLVPDK